MRPNIVTTQFRGLTDLTVLAKVKEGFVEGGFDGYTYLKRLEVVLRTLNAVRLASSESTLQLSPFPDSVGRFRIIHFFRFAILAPDSGADPTRPGRHKLLLNVTFDGGWEPYIRVIWRDLGSLLDLLYCNCEGYPPARLNSFETYAKWVRENEAQTSFFYADSTLSSSDQRYLARAEAIQQAGGAPAAIDAALAELALESSEGESDRVMAKVMAAAVEQREGAALAALRALKAFRGLAPFFPASADGRNDDNGYLLRFTQDVLKEFRLLALKHDLFAGSDALRKMQMRFQADLDWLLKDASVPAVPNERLDFVPAAVQGGILTPYDGVTHGCMVFVCVQDAKRAVEFLKSYSAKISYDQSPADRGIFRNIAFTYRGLKKLDVPEAELGKFPQEFFEGMEMRAGLLGDVRSNHPKQWRRPRQNWMNGARQSGGGRIEFSTVHVVVQFRIASDHKDDPIARLEQEVAKLEKESGLRVLSIQHMKRGAGGSKSKPREPFGFLDGFSQPAVPPHGARETDNKDVVKRGEILLGYSNARGDGPCPAEASRLIDNGTFLVVRKLRQHVEHLDAVLNQQASKLGVSADFLKGKLMGRTVGGEALAAPTASDNQFDYRNDPKGALCPFQSHVRRANPREAGVPRILRRGMSFEPDGSDEPGRGVVFMAYNASIAEQFEVIQRWVAGGNSSGVLTAHSDPFLGVPEGTGKRIFRFMNGGKVLRVELGNKPFVELDWGLYLFVPSVAALGQLDTIVAKPDAASTKEALSPPAPGPAVKPSEDFLLWQRLLEDKDRAEGAWKLIREGSKGVLQTDYGLLVGSKDGVRKVFEDDGSRYSVRGYGERMSRSIGVGYLGLDPQAGHSAQSPPVNKAIASIGEEDAFEAARAAAEAFFEQLPAGEPVATIEVSSLSDYVMAALCTKWFGLPDGSHMKAGSRSEDVPDSRQATCPAHFYSAARFIFSPRPSDRVTSDGSTNGPKLLAAAKKFLAEGGVPGSLGVDIRKALGAQGEQGDLFARTLVGIMQGFPPTVDGNLRTVLGVWLNGGLFWDLQLALLSRGKPPGYATAAAVLLNTMMATMRSRPVPDTLWRTAIGEAVSGEVRADNRVVVGIASALREEPDNALLFGGEYGKATHACPGRKMATGVLLGTISAVMSAGTIRPTGSPLSFDLIREPVAPPPAAC